MSNSNPEKDNNAVWSAQDAIQQIDPTIKANSISGYLTQLDIISPDLVRAEMDPETAKAYLEAFNQG